MKIPLPIPDTQRKVRLVSAVLPGKFSQTAKGVSHRYNYSIGQRKTLKDNGNHARKAEVLKSDSRPQKAIHKNLCESVA